MNVRIHRIVMFPYSRVSLLNCLGPHMSNNLAHYSIELFHGGTQKRSIF
jgi:hypothetical protein